MEGTGLIILISELRKEEILLLFSMVFLLIVSFYFLWGTLKKVKKFQKYSLFFFLFFLIIGFISLIKGYTYIKTISKEQKKLLIKEKEIQKNAEVICEIYQQKIDSLKVIKSKVFELEKVVQDYYRVAEDKNFSSLERFYTDTVKHYFLKENLSKKDIEKQLKFYWKTFPNARFVPKNTIVEISKDSTNFKVLVKGLQFRNNDTSSIINEMYFNEQYKIYYFKAYNSKPENK